ncbi:unnamed protein product [Didymodactylos carnosus]|uniref:Uncharacterized protein n=1 Tax=Didymodactylos carnosus TaxID=1234261 RepID=A0A815IVU5_9BILA|nr:unnamed protein product [Didymodactylos carnosus]CAF4263117.1 unnamed protein product [Didymodactylos carnosus]
MPAEDEIPHSSSEARLSSNQSLPSKKQSTQKPKDHVQRRERRRIELFIGYSDENNTANLPQKQNPSSSSSSPPQVKNIKQNDNQEAEHIVYIPVLPHSESGSEVEKLQETILNRLRHGHRVHPKHCQCLSKIGVGILYTQLLIHNISQHLH